jgi:hypothetical protein
MVKEREVQQNTTRKKMQGKTKLLKRRYDKSQKVSEMLNTKCKTAICPR